MRLESFLDLAFGVACVFDEALKIKIIDQKRNACEQEGCLHEGTESFHWTSPLYGCLPCCYFHYIDKKVQTRKHISSRSAIA